jgi:DNA polymerase-3 subunit delta'
LPAALLIHGPAGVGKQRLALWLAQLAVCTSPGLEGPCEQCQACRMARALEHPDIHWYFPLERPKGASGDRLVDALETARNEALTALREQPLRAVAGDELRGLYLATVRNVRQRAHMQASMADGPVFIIGDADLLVTQEASPEAANALLKLLEEPPGRARFVLTSSAPGRLLPTIRSRTVPLHVGPLEVEEVAEFLMEHLDVSPERAGWAARLSEGSPGRALGFLPDDDDLGTLDALRWKAWELLGAAVEGSVSGACALALGYAPAGARKLLDLFEFLEGWLRDVAAVASGAPERVVNHDAQDRLGKLVGRASLRAANVPLAFAAVERAREAASGNVNPQLIVTSLVRELGAVLSPTPAIRAAGAAPAGAARR